MNKNFIIIAAIVIVSLSASIYLIATDLRRAGEIEEVRFGGSVFLLKEDLPRATRVELDRVLAIDSDFRTASESAWLTARADYVYNEIILENPDGDIVMALGREVPTGTTGFAKGATFYFENKATGLRGQYENIGTNTDSVWEAIGLQQAEVTLSSASFGTISTTPVTLIADPGDGYVIGLVSVTGKRVFSSESWSGVDEELEIKFEDASGPAVVASFSTGFAEGDATSIFETLVPIGVLSSPSEPLVLTASSSHTIDGDTYFEFKAFYYIWDY